MKITEVTARDIRFPTSLELHGSDAVHKAPDYSAVYIVLKTDRPDGLQGYGLTFTVGRGNELVTSAAILYGQMITGKCVEDIFADFGSFWRKLAHEEQLRWLGPEKGVIHLALAGVINALWDLWGRIEGKPVWKLLADMSPEQLVSTIDFSYLSDALTKEEALGCSVFPFQTTVNNDMMTRTKILILCDTWSVMGKQCIQEILRKNEPTKQEREKQLLDTGYPAYTTSAGWIGYTDQQIEELCTNFMRNGWIRFKMKVGGDIQDDIRRAKILRKTLGPDKFLAMDSNQRWDVGEAIETMKKLAEFKPIWIEEPTSPDDVLGHAAISKALAPYGIGVATGEHCQNRVMFKQFLQAGGMQFCQIDSCRMGGLNEILSVLLMAAKFGVPVCPHAGGVGLCEYVQHISIFDYICVSASLDKRVIEYADHLHEHFVYPVNTKNGHYLVPMAPGYSAEMKNQSLDGYQFPNGDEWQKLFKEEKFTAPQ